MDYSRALAMDISCIAFRVIARWATGLLTEIESTVLKVFERLSERFSNALLNLFRRAKLTPRLNRHLLKCESNDFNEGCRIFFFTSRFSVSLFDLLTRT